MCGANKNRTYNPWQWKHHALPTEPHRTSKLIAVGFLLVIAQAVTMAGSQMAPYSLLLLTIENRGPFGIQSMPYSQQFNNFKVVFYLICPLAFLLLFTPENLWLFLLLGFHTIPGIGQGTHTQTHTPSCTTKWGDTQFSHIQITIFPKPNPYPNLNPKP
jgi:hypothetical protein